jgi:ribosome-binding protein aMBF1 (putative translation factor)
MRARRLTPASRPVSLTGGQAVESEVVVMAQVKTVAEWMAQRGMALADLVTASALDDRVVEAIVQGRYTPSPEQRGRLASALGVEIEQIAWGHVAQVSHVYGHGPQFGRSP